eukprot:6148500-Heterocapsa_arctica.AAC.1
MTSPAGTERRQVRRGGRADPDNNLIRHRRRGRGPGRDRDRAELSGWPPSVSGRGPPGPPLPPGREVESAAGAYSSMHMPELDRGAARDGSPGEGGRAIEADLARQARAVASSPE